MDGWMPLGRRGWLNRAVNSLAFHSIARGVSSNTSSRKRKRNEGTRVYGKRSERRIERKREDDEELPRYWNGVGGTGSLISL